MTVELEIAGRRFRAVVRNAKRHGAESVLRVTLQSVDDPGEAIDYTVDASATDHGVLLAHGDGRVVDAAVATTKSRDEMLVQLPRVDISVRVGARPSHDAARSEASETGPRHVCAPMPGRIVRVLVCVDQEVTAGDPLVVVEAMKMENAITAPRDGRVRDVTAVEGGSVESGRVLLTIE